MVNPPETFYLRVDGRDIEFNYGFDSYFYQHKKKT